MATTQQYDDARQDVEQNGSRASSTSLRLVRAEASQAGGRGNKARAALDKHSLPHTG
jgi:hypothetical protein